MAGPPPGDASVHEIEVLDDGRAPQGARRWADRRGLSQRSRRVLSIVAVAVLLAAALKTSIHHAAAKIPGQSSSVSTTSIARTPPAEAIELLGDQYGFSAGNGSLSLMLSVVNYGTTAIDVLRTRLPQAGTRPVSGPGGDLPFASPVTLFPDLPTPLTVLARVSCPSVLTAPLTDHVDVTLGRGGQPIRVASLSLDSLGTIIDDARHQACGAKSASGAIYPMMVPGSVHALPATADRPALIVSELRIKNVVNGETTVSIAGANPSAVTADDGGPVTLQAAQTSVVSVHWRVSDCAELAAVRWPTLVLSVHLATSSANNTYGFDDTFGAAWRGALQQVCSTHGG